MPEGAKAHQHKATIYCNSAQTHWKWLILSGKLGPSWWASEKKNTWINLCLIFEEHLDINYNL